MFTDDFVIIIEQLRVSKETFSENLHLILVMKTIKEALIDTKLLTVPENFLFIIDQLDVNRNTSSRTLDLYWPRLICTHSYLCSQKISAKTPQLKISPTKTSWFAPVKKLDGYYVVFLSPQVQIKDGVQWKEIRVATLRDIWVHRGISMHPILSAQAKEISEMAAKLNFTLVETWRADYDKHIYYASIPAVSMSTGVNGRTTGWGYSARGSLFQTFLYCTDKKLDSANLLAFLNPCGLKMWFRLAMSFLGLYCFVVFSRGAPPGYAVILILTSALVAQSVEKVGMKGKELVLVWRFMAFLLSTLYICFIGSLLVVPVKHNRLKTFEDLVKNQNLLFLMVQYDKKENTS